MKTFTKIGLRAAQCVVAFLGSVAFTVVIGAIYLLITKTP